MLQFPLHITYEKNEPFGPKDQKRIKIPTTRDIGGGQHSVLGLLCQNPSDMKTWNIPELPPTQRWAKNGDGKMACLCDPLCVQFCMDIWICAHTHTSLFHLYIMPKERSWPTLGGSTSDCYLLLDIYWNHLDFVQDTINTLWMLQVKKGMQVL